MVAVEVRNVRRTFLTDRRSGASVTALDDVSLTIEPEQIHGLLGPNGAGKTTLVKILATVLLPTSGSARVLGHDVVSDVKQVRTCVGVVLGGERGLYTRVSARQNLQFWGALYRLGGAAARRRADELLERVGLSGRADEPVENFSRGMKQRLHLARGLIHDPQVIFLDEPTSGMDPAAAHDFRALVRELQGEGRSMLLTTHDMAEAEALCGHVTLIDKGRVLLSASTSSVSSSLGARECIDFTSVSGAALAEALAAMSAVSGVERRDAERNGWRVYLRDAAQTADVLRWFLDHDVLSARRAEPTLEEVYLHTVGAGGMAL